LREKNLPPDTLIEHWQLVRIERLETVKGETIEDTAILRIATTAYKSKNVSVYIYDGPSGSREIRKEIPPDVVGRLVGETMTDLLRSGVWVKPPSPRDERGGLANELGF